MTTTAQPTRTASISINLRALITTTCMLLAAPFAQADDAQNFTEVAPGVVRDSRTGLEWMRCSLGQEWSQSKTCTGEVKNYQWQGAQDIAKKMNAVGYAQRFNWRVPSNRELASIRYCSNGFVKETTDLQDGKPPVQKWCVENSTSPTITPNVFPATPVTWYWTSTPTAGSASNAWVVNFLDGNIFSHNGYRLNGYAVRLVR